MKQNKERPGVMIYFHIFEMLKLLDTQQVGEVMLALMAYAKDGIEPQFREQAMQIVWVNMKNASDVDKERYAERCKNAKAAIEKRWNKQEDTDVYERIPTDTKHTNHNTNTETDTESETNTKTDADAVTQASASANTETEKETGAPQPPRLPRMAGESQEDWRQRNIKALTAYNEALRAQARAKKQRVS